MKYILLLLVIIFQENILRMFYKDTITIEEAMHIIDALRATDKRLQFLERALVLGIIETESNFRVKAVSKYGAKGLMQLKQKTFDWISDTYDLKLNNVFDPVQNIKAGMYFLYWLYQRHKDIDIMIHEYYTGHKGYDEGRRNWLYVATVKKNYLKFKGLGY